MKFNDFLLQICGEEIPQLFIFDFSTAPSLLFYSYVPIILISLAITVYILIKDKRSLQSKSLLVFTLFFIFWVIAILVQWVSSYHRVLMFGWQITAFIELGIYIAAVHFTYVFLLKKDFTYYWRVIFVSIMTMVAIITPTEFNIVSYDVLNCEGNLGPLWQLIYIIEPAMIVLIVCLGIIKYRQNKEKLVRQQTVMFVTGIATFLTIFFISNLYGEITGIYEFNLWGPVGMVIFIGFFAYIVVKFKLFNLKLIGSNILVVVLWVLNASLLTVHDINISHNITIITLIISIVFGLILIKSVKREVLQRERIEALAIDLRKANDRLTELDIQKSEFVSFASHQLRAPLTAIKGYSSLLLEGEFGVIGKETTEAISRIFESSKTLATMVDDYLNISRIELGTMKYSFDMIDLKELAQNVIAELKPNIEKSKLDFTFATDPADPKERFMIHADKNNLKQVVGNLIDNSIKYTPSGSIKVSLAKNKETRKVTFSIKDTGVGIDPAVMPKLFSKFVRALNADKQNIYGTGLGLFVAKEIVLAHKGRLWAESKGEGKGSTFFLEMDMEV